MDLRGSTSSRRISAIGVLLALVVSTVLVQPMSWFAATGTAAAAPAANPTASAACTVTWTGSAGDQQWSSSGNWSSGNIPSATDVACIGGTAGAVILNAGYGQVFPVGSLYIDPGSSLSIGLSILFFSDAGATSVINDLAITNYYGGIDGPGSIEIPSGGTWTWSSGGARGFGSITVDAGATATIDVGSAVTLYLYRHITSHGHLTITTAGAPSYAGSVSISQQPPSATDAGGLLTADGPVDIDASLVQLLVTTGSAVDAIDFTSVTTGHVIGGHRVELFGVNGFGGSWTIDPATLLKIRSMPRAITVAASVLVDAGGTFGIGYGDAHLTGSVSGPGTFCPEYGTVFLDNVHALDFVSRVDTGECDGTFIGAGKISVPRGQTAQIQQLRTSFDSSVTGGGTLEIIGDGVDTTTDLTMGGNYGRSGFTMQDATVVVAHGASASFGAGSTETLYSPDPNAPAGAQTTLVNHGTFTWNNTYLSAQPATRFDNAADGVLNIVAAKADPARGASAGFADLDGSFTNEGVINITSGDFMIDGRRAGPSLLGGQVNVAPGSVLLAMRPQITGTLDLHGGDATTPGGALQADGDNIVVDGTLRLGSRSKVTDTYYDVIVHPTGTVHADIDGPQGTLTGRIAANRTAVLDGRLDVTTLAGYTPTTSPIDIITSPTVTGTFASFTASPLAGGAWSAVYSPTTAGVVANGEAPVITAPDTVTATTVEGDVIFGVSATASATITITGLPDGVVYVPALNAVLGTASVAGTYTITITATNGIGTSTATTTLVVTAPSNHAPIVQATVTPSTGTIYAPATVRLDLTGTTDPDGAAELSTWSVSISDGTTTTAGPSGGPATMIAPHDVTLPVTGQDTTFTITVTVTDVQGATGSASVGVTVLAPQVQVSFTTEPSAGGGAFAVDFHPTVTGRDVADVAEWKLDFGDGILVQSGTGPIPSTITRNYPGAGSYTATLSVMDAAGHVLATFSSAASASNQSPHAIFDLSTMATTTSPKVLVYQSDNPKSFKLSSPTGFVVIDATRSFDPDGANDIASWDVQTLQDGAPFNHFAGSGPITAPITTQTPGSLTAETKWTVKVAVTDRTGATSLAEVTYVVPSYQGPVANRPPVAILPTVRVNSASGGVVSADPGLSYDPDAAVGDAIKSWTVELIDLDSKATTVDSGSGQPPRAVPVKLPTDLRGGTMFIRLTVTDTKGATGQTTESIRFNTCDATAAAPLPYDATKAAAGGGTVDGAAAWLDATLKDPSGALPAGTSIGRSPLTVTFTDRSFDRSTTLVSHSLADIGGTYPAGYGMNVPYELLDAPAPITDTLTFNNDLDRPIDYTFALTVTDLSGATSKQFLTIIVLPPSSPRLSLTINKSTRDPRAIEVTPNADPSLGNRAWQLVTSGLGPADVTLDFGPGTALSTQTIVVPRPSGTTLTADFRFRYGAVDDLNALTLCEPRPLPVLSQSDVNKAPSLTVTPAVQHTTGAAQLRIVASDPDPAPLGAADAQALGLNAGDPAGLISVSINGVSSPLELFGSTTGASSLDTIFDIPAAPPGSGPGPRAFSIIVRDAWGGSTSFTAYVYDDPPTAPIDSGTLTLTHAPTFLVRGSTTTETIALTGAKTATAPVVLAVDLPVDATLSQVNTEVLGSTTTVDALAVGKPQAGRWFCTVHPGTTANRLVCAIPSLTNPMPKLYVTFSTVTQKAVLPIVAGATQGASGQTIDALITSVRDVTALDTLRLHALETVSVIGVLANAGPDQSVPDVTIQPDGSRTATHVTLDGSRTAGDGRPLTFTWTQLSGAPVVWTSPANAGTTATVIGQQVQFDAPFLRLGGSARFQLTVTAPAGGGRPAATTTDTVTITFTAPPDRAPVISSLTSSPDATLRTPATRTPVVLSAGASDPDGDPLTYSWRAWAGTGATGAAVATSSRPVASQRLLPWPANTPQLTVEVTVSDGRGQSTVRQLVLGVPVPPVHISITGSVAGTPLVAGPPPTADPGASIDLTAVTDRAPSGGISWTLVSGPAPAGVTFPVQGAVLHLVAPAVTAAGQSLVVRATATDTRGNATADQTINLTAVPPPSVALTVWPGNGAPPAPGSGLLDPLQPVLVPIGGIFSGSAAATGSGTLTYRWTTSPAAAITSSTSPSTTFTAPSSDAFLTVTVQVTDSTGQTASASRVVQVGAGFPTTTLNCGNPVFSDLIRQASANAGRAAGSLLDVSVPIGQPPIGVFNLGKLTFTGDCTTAPSLTFGGASFTLFNGAVSGTGASGSATPTGLCLTGGQVTLSPELGLGPTSLGSPASPLCISIDPADWGTPDPPVPDAPAPDPATPPRSGQGTTPPDPSGFRLPTISCTGSSPISGSLTWIGAFPGITLPGPKLTTVKFDCGFLELTSTVSAPWGDLALRGLIRRDGSFEAAVTTSGLRLFGSGANTELTGKLRRTAAGAITWSVAAHIPTPNLGVGALAIDAVDVSLSPNGFSLSGDGTVHPGGTAPDINVHLGGTITGQDEFTATLTGSLASSWTVAPGLTIGSGAVTASIARSGGRTDLDLFLAASGDWPIVAPQLTLRQITARLSNRTAPTGCVAQAGDLWAQVSGTAHLDLGSGVPVIDLTASACVGLNQPTLMVSTTASLNSWKPISGQDFTFSSIGFTATLGSDGAWTFDVSGDANYAGIRLAGRVRVITSPLTLVVDVGGDLSGLHIPMLSSGHVVFTSAPVNGYEPMPIAGVAAPPIDLDAGLTAFADISLPASMRDALGKILNPPAPQPPVIAIPDTIRFTAALGATNIKLEGSISFPAGQGLTLFATCPAEAPHNGSDCVLTDPMTTSLQLQSLFISIDTSGKLGFGGTAVIQFAAGDGVTKPPPLPVTAEASIDLTGPAINLALYTTADWPNAMGIQGLTLGNLAIQGGVSFATYPPVPTIGFGATIKQLPANVASMLGIQSPQEPMTFVINIAPTKPILQISLGQHDGKTFLKPIQPISAANADALTIDDANLIFAPLGGDVGPYHYDPGISLSFGGSLLGISVSGSARISLNPPNIHADLDIGDIVFGTGSSATVVKATHFLFDATPTAVVLQASGGIDIAGGPSAQMMVDVHATLVPPAASATFALDVRNWSLPFVDTAITKLHMEGQFSASIGSLPSLTLTATGTARTGSAVINLGGTVGVTNGRLTALNVNGSISGLNLFGVQFSGPGCPAISTPSGTIPATTSGVCLRAGFSPAATPSLSIGFAGTATVAGLSLDVAASFGPTGLHGTGTLRSPDLGNPSFTGDIWFGSALAGVTATDDIGTVRQVQPGDFRFAGAMNLPGVFSGSSLSGSLGDVGGRSWIEADGTLMLNNRRLAGGHLDISSSGIDATGSFTLASPFGSGPSLSISLSGHLTYATATTQLGYVLTATMAAQPSAADPAQRALGGASFTLRRGTPTGSPTFFIATGNINLQGITGSFSGTVSTAGNFCLNANLSIAALGASGSGTIGGSCSTPGFTIDVTMTPLSTSPTFRFAGRITTGTASFTVSATDTRRIMLQGTHPYIAGINNTQVQDWVYFSTSVSASLNWSNTSGFTLSLQFSANARVRWLVLRASNGSTYVTNFDSTIGVSFSNNKLCATIPGIDAIPGVHNPVCI